MVQKNPVKKFRFLQNHSAFYLRKKVLLNQNQRPELLNSHNP